MDLSRKQLKLSQTAATCVHILDEEGTTIVFPRILSQLVEDMKVVAARLSDLHVGALTQAMEEEIVTTIAEAIKALEKMQAQNEQNQPPQRPGMPGDETAPLLPTSAELKLLRSAQLRVNTRTAAIDEAQEAGKESEESLAGILDKTAQRQAECAEIAKAVLEQSDDGGT